MAASPGSDDMNLPLSEFILFFNFYCIVSLFGCQCTAQAEGRSVCRTTIHIGQLRKNKGSIINVGV
jgi:hypothetical protein